ncbi:MAG TPA: hypothetical protein VEK07_23620 [Polyangiaceae bacterium]|nr:hypothetical protein [Polyangiaceae bacterium]
MYIAGGQCEPLVINGPEAAAVLEDMGPTDAGVDGPASPADATVIDGSTDNDSDVVDSSLTSIGIDLDALNLDVQCADGTPVPICVEYYAYLSVCFARSETDLACQPSLLDTPDADLASIESLCESNLQRLEGAC